MNERISRAGQLDAYDRAILDILRVDNRTSQRVIAERVNLSAAAVQRRIAAMEAKGTILANVALVNPVIDGPRTQIVVEVHLVNDRSEVVGPTKELFRGAGEIEQCFYVTGDGGFILVVSVPDMVHYEAFAKRLFADNPLVSSFRTLVVLEVVKSALSV